ncbi:non-ribosomal peptide synthetase [Rhizobium rhizogenes]|uniref:non-ribosomal peptide synthetase n=1 Tax=Rhizobium rhizogenes TaxID=359 RepID=UPI001AED259A|nr:non-ribosomal peptide synthetase [Rhizobium rhizogenes]
MFKEEFAMYVHGRFAQHAASTPNKGALEVGDCGLTYEELATSAAAVREFLTPLTGHGFSTVVILSSDPVNYIPSIIGALEAGCVFVPLDLQMPESRVATLLDELEPKVIVTDKRHLNTLMAYSCMNLAKVMCIEDIFAIGIKNRPWSSFADDVQRPPNDPAYIYYTSGSTGRPKGILGRLNAIDHFITWEVNALEIGEEARVSHLTTPAFDASLRDIFAPLCSGGTIVAPPSRRIVAEGALLVEWIDQKRITHLHCVPSVFRTILNEPLQTDLFSSLRYIALAGEPLLPADAARWMATFGTRIQLVNMYGPTETTMTKFAHFVSPDDLKRQTIPIGAPIEGTKAMVVDPSGRPVLSGTIGEIYIRTRYCSLGYFRQQELTDVAFFSNPLTGDKEDLIYRTGDFGRVLDNGMFELLGRRDSQVKIGGVRIELTEIESTLRSHPAILDVAVIERDGGHHSKYLCAYVVLGEPSQLDLIRSHLVSLLPPTHVPSFFVPLEKLPRTITGKIDRNMLPVPLDVVSFGLEPLVRPCSPVQEVLVEMWAHLLGHSDIGVTADFFAMGGSSLMATKLLARVHDAFEVEVPLQQLLRRPTIEGLSEAIGSAKNSTNLSRLPQLVPASRSKPLPLSFAQERLWATDRIAPAGTLNMTVGIRIDGRLDTEILERAVQHLVRRHEILRTIFVEQRGGPRQIVLASTEVPFPIHDLRKLSRREGDIQFDQITIAEARHPFDLEKGPPLKTTLVLLDDGLQILVVSMHHIVCDAHSFSLLLQELGTLYSTLSQPTGNVPVAVPALHYADFAAWQRTWATSEYFERGLEFWRQMLAGSPTLLTLPTDRPRPPLQDFKGAHKRFWVPTEVTKSITRVAREHGVTLFMALFAAFVTMLYRHSGQDDLLVGTPKSNRNQEELQNIFGFFADILVLRVDFSGNPTFTELLAQIRKRALEAYGFSEVPFEKLVEVADHPRESGHTPLVQVAFGLEELQRECKISENLNMQLQAVETGIAKFDIFMALARDSEQLKGIIEYRTVLFDVQSIEQMITSFQNILASVAADPRQTVDAISIIQSSTTPLDETSNSAADTQNLQARIARLVANREGISH